MPGEQGSLGKAGGNRETADFPTRTSWHLEFRAVIECVGPAIIRYSNKWINDSTALLCSKDVRTIITSKALETLKLARNRKP